MNSFICIHIAKGKPFMHLYKLYTSRFSLALLFSMTEYIAITSKHVPYLRIDETAFFSLTILIFERCEAEKEQHPNVMHCCTAKCYYSM